ncbi:MAG: hypothetical protein WA003_15575 [Desulfuromonadaceae bacterium]
MGFFDSVMEFMDPISASIVTDQGEAIGVDVPDSHAVVNVYDPYVKADAAAIPTVGTAAANTKAKTDARARIDAQMAKWRASKKPPVERADDPRHKEVWPLLNKYVPDWKSETRGKGNALAAQAQPGGNNALAAGPFDSPETQADILNQYYGGSGVGMFVQ